MTTVTREMIGAAHDVMLAKGDFVLSANLLEKIYRAMRAREPKEGDAPIVGDGGTALEVHGTVFFKNNHQYRSQLRFPIADGAYELVKIENPDMTHPLFHVAGESFECSPDAEGEAHNPRAVRPTEDGQ